MSAIEAVLLDLGNVLVFHDDAVLFRRLSEWGGAPPELVRERMLALWAPINRGTLADAELRRAVCAAAGAAEPMDAEAFFALWNCHFRINQELLPMVDTLLAQVKVVLVTNVNALHWRYVRPLIPQFDRFSGFVVSCALGMAKPDAAMFENALAQAQVGPAKAAYFDDIPLYVEAARALGMVAQVFTDAPTFRRQLAELGLRI
jgi:HAD superfamily hydrolase (TIGR01509 family)